MCLAYRLLLSKLFCLCCDLAAQWLLTLGCALLAPPKSAWLHFESFSVLRFPPSVGLYALDAVNSEVMCFCTLLNLINPPASLSLSGGAESLAEGTDTAPGPAWNGTLRFPNSPKCCSGDRQPGLWELLVSVREQAQQRHSIFFLSFFFF